MPYSECLPTRLNPLAERICFSQVGNTRNHITVVSMITDRYRSKTCTILFGIVATLPMFPYCIAQFLGLRDTLFALTLNYEFATTCCWVFGFVIYVCELLGGTPLLGSRTLDPCPGFGAIDLLRCVWTYLAPENVF